MAQNTQNTTFTGAGDDPAAAVDPLLAKLTMVIEALEAKKREADEARLIPEDVPRFETH
jgi:hypothetical protein